jgi:MFS family permease
VTALGGPVMATYFNLFFTDGTTGLGLSATQLGYILATGTAIGLGLMLPAGWIVDRYGPKKIWGWSGLLVGLSQLLMFLVADSVVTVSITYALFAAINTMMTASLLPMMYSFIPKEKFGQLNGANQIVGRCLQIVGVNACGLLISLVNQQYRYAFIFGGIAYMLAPVFLFLMLKQPWPYGALSSSMNPDGKLGILKEEHAADPFSDDL